MTRPLVKICGIRRPEDATVAVEVGADFVGMIFAQESKRKVSTPEAARVVAAVKSVRVQARTVGVFVDTEPDEINAIVSDAGLDMVQLHGSEPDESV
ncbi:MAG: N-(5'-phosphoribosyl)anthranilate isomerase, partial [Thermoanaerobaculia bacterium]|nr:N-(5'-phosphoribosyl)anthranilate isomerase [Thermoanaerobaculia bacterium]